MKKIFLQSLFIFLTASLFANTFTYTDFNESEYEKVKDAYDLIDTYSQTGKQKF